MGIATGFVLSAILLPYPVAASLFRAVTSREYPVETHQSGNHIQPVLLHDCQ